ncbi:MAG TPA: OmpA family protein [Syntrophales bacterium]|nr:OmpA family protein [Syntrophales bacterium]
MERICAWVFVTVFVFSGVFSEAGAADAEQSLVSFSSGALVVKKPREYNESWGASWILDERPESGWASPKGAIANNVFVMELAEKTLLTRLEFDIGQVDGNARGAKDILVEVSDVGPSSGFKEITNLTLVDRQDKQSFPVKVSVPGRWVRLTVRNNQGSPEYTELMDFRGYGRQLTKTDIPDVSGTYATNWKDFHLRRQGTAVTGCYEYREGVLNGGIEGRVMKFTWREKDHGQGPAVMVFTSDGKKFFGLWWYEGKTNTIGNVWNGELKSKDVGGCPHWAGGAQEQMKKDLAELGRVRVYGINFDVDSAVIRSESRPTLDKIVALLKSDPALRLTIEGHTDSTGTAEHNQVLSQQRAESVKNYLVAAGVSAGRLSAAGFGASRPVASNSTDMGKAQNRRVELVKR